MPRRGYSLFVRLMKWGLPLVALVIVGVLISRFQENTAPTPSISGTPAVTPEGQIALVGARYEGVDDKHRPFRVTADEASHALTGKDNVSLKKPMADMALGDNSWIAASADQGEYARDAAELALSGNVRIFHDSGYELLMDEVLIHLKTSAAESKKAVKAQGPAGLLEAASLDITQQGDSIVFKGPAKLTLFPSAFKGAAP